MASNFSWKWPSKVALAHEGCWTDCWWGLGAAGMVTGTDLCTPLFSHQVSSRTRVMPFPSQSPAKVSCPWLSHWKGFMAVSLQLHWPSGSILGIGGTLHLPGRSHRAVKPQRKRRQAVSVPCSYNVVKQIRVVLSYTEKTGGANFWGVFCSIV